jgi:Stress responsive A/B Barrel Domain
MLTHIVCWKYKTEVTEEQREAHRARLRALVGVIPEIITFECGSDMLHLPRSYDTGLASTFADAAALDSYTAHPQHQGVAALGRDISDHIVSVDFVTED